jgi:hypothetical protein
MSGSWEGKVGVALRREGGGQVSRTNGDYGEAGEFLGDQLCEYSSTAYLGLGGNARLSAASDGDDKLAAAHQRDGHLRELGRCTAPDGGEMGGANPRLWSRSSIQTLRLLLPIPSTESEFATRLGECAWSVCRP